MTSIDVATQTGIYMTMPTGNISGSARGNAHNMHVIRMLFNKDKTAYAVADRIQCSRNNNVQVESGDTESIAIVSRSTTMNH